MLNAGEAEIDEYEMNSGFDDVPDVVESYAKSAQATFWLTLAAFVLPFMAPIVWFALGFVAIKRGEVTEADEEIARDATNPRGTRLRDGDRYFRWGVATHAIFLVAFAIAMILLPSLLA